MNKKVRDSVVWLYLCDDWYAILVMTLLLIALALLWPMSSHLTTERLGVQMPKYKVTWVEHHHFEAPELIEADSVIEAEDEALVTYGRLSADQVEPYEIRTPEIYVTEIQE